MHCPLCRCADAATFATWEDFSILRCVGCGFRFVDVLAPGYPPDAQFVYDDEVGPIRPESPHIRRRVRDILNFKQPPGRALDIGCGKGEVSIALRKAGFECAGWDMKTRAISHLRLRFPEISWQCISFPEMQDAAGRYELITLYHVLEHVPDPRAVLASVKAMANGGALIVIEVPNVGGWEARLKGRHWHYYKVDHVNYFRASDLRRLAEDLELEVLRIRGYQHFSYPQDVLWKDFVKGVLGRVGFTDVISVFLRA